jgi:hypothetical protein
VTIAAAGSVRGEAARTPRLAFVVDRGTADLYALLMALQGQGLAQVVQEGEVPSPGAMVHTFDAGGLLVAVRHGERLRGDGGAGFVADAVVPVSPLDRARSRALQLWTGRRAPRLLRSRAFRSRRARSSSATTRRRRTPTRRIGRSRSSACTRSSSTSIRTSP